MGDQDVNDGLNDSEATRLLFKNFMNYTSTSQFREFYEEGDLANHSNIYSKGVLTDTPPVYYSSPSYISIGNDVSLSEYLKFSGIDDISINTTWFADKISAGGSFSVNETDDDNRRILRLEKIKLDFLGSGTKAFVCKDNNDNNILKNLIPPNYSTYGYSLQLFVTHDTTGAISEMTWLSTASSCNAQTGLSGNNAVGAPLFDAKNGIITFYDIGTNVGDSNFETIESKGIYLTATKYIGLSDVKKVRSIDVMGNLSVSGDVIFDSSLDISGVMSTSNDFVFEKDSIERMIIDSSSIHFVNSDPSYTAVDISSTSALGLPVGRSAERPVDEKKGHIRYNDQLNQFEGYGDGGWQGLGGVIDNDQDTTIITDNSNNLIFDTSGSTQMVINSDGDVSMANNLTVGGTLEVSSNLLYVDSSSGNVGIGTSDPSYTLHINGTLYTSSGMSIGKELDPEYELDVSGDIHCTGTLFADSDIKVKKNLVQLDNSLYKLSKLNGYYYHKVGEEEDSLKHIGVIAQEVEAEYPELVSKNTDIKSVNYDGINAILIECVKELRKENLAIKSELEELKNKFGKI